MVAALSMAVLMVRPPEVTLRSPSTRYTIWWYGREAVGGWIRIG